MSFYKEITEALLKEAVGLTKLNFDSEKVGKFFMEFPELITIPTIWLLFGLTPIVTFAVLIVSIIIPMIKTLESYFKKTHLELESWIKYWVLFNLIHFSGIFSNYFLCFDSDLISRILQLLLFSHLQETQRIFAKTNSQKNPEILFYTFGSYYFDQTIDPVYKMFGENLNGVLINIYYWKSLRVDQIRRSYKEFSDWALNSSDGLKKNEKLKGKYLLNKSLFSDKPKLKNKSNENISETNPDKEKYN